MNKKIKNKIETPNAAKKGFRAHCAVVITIAMITALSAAALAADDPIAVVNNLSDFIFGLIRAVGLIILGWGVVQVGMSIQSHDASQRTQGLLCLFGGLLIAFAKEILTLIGAV